MPVFWLTIAWAVLTALMGCGSPPERQAADGDEPSPVADERPLLRLGVISRYNPILMYRTYQPLADYLSANTPYRFELALGRTYRDAVRLLESGSTDLACLGGVTYLMAREQFGARPLVKPLNVEGRPEYRSAFAVREGSPIGSLADLPGHSLALGSGYSTAGNLVPRLELARAGVRLEDLSHFAYLSHHEQVAAQVLSGAFDAGAMKDEVARHFSSRGLRIIHLSEAIPSVPVTARPDLPDSVTSILIKALLSLQPGDLPGGGAVPSWNAEYQYGFVPAVDGDYEPLRQTLSLIPGGCAQGCHEQRAF